MRLKFLVLLVITLAVIVAMPAMASVVNVYTVGSNPAGNALDPVGNNIGGVPVISWNQSVSCSGCPVYLSILAEGIDGGPTAPGAGERDEVFVNGNSVGFLTQANFYSPLFNLQPGPGALAGITLETTSLFDITAYAVSGLNTISVNVDAGNWINEVEVSEISEVPEPASMMLLGSGLAAVAGRVRRKIRK
jgi:hypothetical protein